MMKKIIKKLLKFYGWKLIKLRKPPEPTPYGKLDSDLLNSLNNSKGVLHLGAHRGVEAEVYNWFGKNVIWVEALPKLFEELKDNLYFYKNQKAFQGVISDVDEMNIDFNVSNFDAACSSMFTFTENIKKSEKWSNRDHKMIKTIKLKSIKLDTLFEKNNIDPVNYNHWVLDLQGAELLALKGGEKSLNSCKSLYIEVSIKKFYKNAVEWKELRHWLSERNFFPTKNPDNDEEDILFIKK